MDDIGSEVGQKMRSAVKAKLIEIGTEGLTGYIDDELPDYVMIMIANKRSKEQMVEDLGLFLGTQTELFVTWLHEVLQKLQEVTIPATAVHKNKRKAELIEAPIVGKKEKKDKKKEKEKKLKKGHDINQTSSSSVQSISDVFADHLLQKAKKTLQVENSNVAKIKKNESGSSSNRITRDEFDIPTITEITESVEDIQQKKDLEELERIQQKIYQAKAKLKLHQSEDSEDEDYLNIKADGEENIDEDNTTEKSSENKKNKIRIPIVFDSNVKSINSIADKSKNFDSSKFLENKSNYDNDDKTTDKLEKSRKRIPISYTSEQKEIPKKRSIHERLGFQTKIISNASGSTVEASSSFRRRIEKEPIAIGKTRAKSVEKNIEKSNSIEKDEREKNINKFKQKSSDDFENDTVTTLRHRIGSRVIVAPPKIIEEEDYDDTIDKAVSSMIKIKPRPSISPSKQASKNLLLRAVAEAQKSLLTTKKISIQQERSPKRLNTRSQRTKPFNVRNRENTLNRLKKNNFIVEIKSNNNDRNEGQGDEYVPEPIYDRRYVDDDYVYIPQTINFDAADGEYSDEYEDESEQFSANKTQFVVTLHEKNKRKFPLQIKSRIIEKNLNGLQTEKLVERINDSPKLTKSTACEDDDDFSMSSYDSPPNSPKLIAASTFERDSKKSDRNIILDKAKKITINRLKDDKKYGKKNEPSHLESKILSPKATTPSPKKMLTIKKSSKESENRTKLDSNKEDIEDGSLTPPLPKVMLDSLSKSRKRSPIKFDLNDSTIKNSSKDDEHQEKRGHISKNVNLNLIEDNNQTKISIKKLEVAKKYENIPEFLSTVAVEATNKVKVKERCKYFPNCGKGESCEYHHPTTPCKAFPNCKFIEKCLYLHPKCKFDLTCNRINCNFSHTVALNTTNTAPPLSSHVVPVQNYKSISANALPAICKYYPNCTNTVCNFYHPKLCRFGKNCMNKVECNFYHYELPIKDKFKWVASLG